MSQLHFTINQEDIQNLISKEEQKNDRAKCILTKVLNQLMEREERFQKSLAVLDDFFEDSFIYYFNYIIHSRFKSTNCSEILNEEVRRKEKISWK